MLFGIIKIEDFFLKAQVIGEIFFYYLFAVLPWSESLMTLADMK